MNMEKFPVSPRRKIFVTGVSSGIGMALARKYLSLGCTVYGISRREPHDLLSENNFNFMQLDLSEHVSIPRKLDQLIQEDCALDIVVLNAGMAGQFGDMGEISLEIIKRVMDVNTWSNKVILDHLFSGTTPPSQVVGMSTGASISGNRGWNAYALSKAALNMLLRLYSKEFPGTHFCTLAPGLVDTDMLKSVLSLPSDGTHPTIDRLKSKVGTFEIESPDNRAETLVRIIDRLPGEVESGAFADSRDMGRNF